MERWLAIISATIGLAVISAHHFLLLSGDKHTYYMNEGQARRQRKVGLYGTGLMYGTFIGGHFGITFSRTQRRHAYIRPKVERGVEETWD